jgi:hypothetical protein
VFLAGDNGALSRWKMLNRLFTVVMRLAISA